MNLIVTKLMAQIWGNPEASNQLRELTLKGPQIGSQINLGGCKLTLSTYPPPIPRVTTSCLERLKRLLRRSKNKD